MLVLSTTNLPEEIEAKLINQYPSLDFKFCEDIESALPYLADAEILLTYGEDLQPAHIDQATSLKWIAVLSAGLEMMPLAEIKAANILVTNSKGIHKIPMAEYAISMLLQVKRKTKTFIENQQKHIFDRLVPMQEIGGGTMMIVGAGAIGQELARLAQAFRMKTIGVSTSGSPKEHFNQMITNQEILDVLPEADYVISILPSTAETEEFFTAAHFKKMKASALFLNMGRGDAVSKDVILEALANEEIAHVILDVYEEEPLPSDHPFWDHEKITMTPHVSSKSPNYVPRAVEILEANMSTYLNNGTDYINKIDLDRGY
ncbi:D-2-hydroxyacid dehydrogenase [Radiobacillus sp. PE A8.2]|uniref:D-2-hydroxyacid dehydrogenase n=1 Tax=Radiobacillus sp. PE A8.2 TaxID=3380349 RepID=UPI00388E0314